MKDSSKTKGKKGAKEGDEEMTVVVPPSKKPQSTAPPADSDGDVSMAAVDKDDNAEEDGEPKVDPVAQTIAGKQAYFLLKA
jgi:26S proteasome regulatory subunit N3